MTIRKLVYVSMLVFMSPVCHANVIVPSLVMIAPVMWLMLGAVIVIEALMLKKYWQDISLSKIFFRSTIANLVTTIVGVPLVCVLYRYLVTEPAGWFFGTVSLHQDITSPVLLNILRVIGLILQAGVIFPEESENYLYITLYILLIPCFFCSYWIESMFYTDFGLEEQVVIRDVKKAHIVSYGFIAIVVACIYLIERYITDSMVLSYMSSVIFRVESFLWKTFA
ncbi:hypothetical protein [Rickettsia sp. TH2014]|uniref:hypothetical protein n=1 Tax=Rickettsia sp. TH2014 TaxID=1967503 RepID=UPI001C45D4EE|nr:hypothetical protein [Rickettsia sp. TH2014]